MMSKPRQAPQQPPLPQLRAGSVPQPRTCYTCGQHGHVKKDYPHSAQPAGGTPSASSSGGSSSTKNPTNKSKDGGSQGSSPYPSKNTIPASERTFGALCAYCQRIGHTIDQCRKKKYDDTQASQNFAQPVDDGSWNPVNLSTDLYASQFNYAYSADDNENFQGHISLVCKRAADGLPVYVSKNIPQRKSARLGEKEAAGKKVT